VEVGHRDRVTKVGVLRPTAIDCARMTEWKVQSVHIQASESDPQIGWTQLVDIVETDPQKWKAHISGQASEVDLQVERKVQEQYVHTEG